MSTTQENLDNFYDRQVERVAQSLEDYAQRIRSSGRRRENSPQMMPLCQRAESVLSDFRSMIGNTPIDALLSAAHQADGHRMKGDLE